MPIDKKKIIKILDKHLGKDYLLFVFGSCAKGGVARISDIDLAIFSSSKIPSNTFLRVKEDLEQNAGTLRNIDLVNLNDEGINVDLLKNILKDGVIWKKAKNSKELLRNLQKRLRNLTK